MERVLTGVGMIKIRVNMGKKRSIFLARAVYGVSVGPNGFPYSRPLSWGRAGRPVGKIFFMTFGPGKSGRLWWGCSGAIKIMKSSNHDQKTLEFSLSRLRHSCAMFIGLRHTIYMHKWLQGCKTDQNAQKYFEYLCMAGGWGSFDFSWTKGLLRLQGKPDCRPRKRTERASRAL